MHVVTARAKKFSDDRSVLFLARTKEYIERFDNTKRRHATIGYLSPVEYERKLGLAYRVSFKPV